MDRDSHTIMRRAGGGLISLAFVDAYSALRESFSSRLSRANAAMKEAPARATAHDLVDRAWILTQ